MPKITFHEFRPGKWVKQVDGKVVGPATAAEVAAWKQEKAAPARIWEDVVKHTKSPTAKAPAGPGAPKEPDQSTLWEDLLKRTQRSVQAEGPPKPHSRQEDTDWAEQAQIWQDVLKRAQKPGPEPQRQPAQGAPISPKPAPEAKPKPATKASPAPASAPAKTVSSPPATKPAGEGATAKKAFAAELVSPKLAEMASRPTAAAKPEEKAAPIRKAPDAKPAPKPTPPAELAAKAEAKPRREPAPAQKVLPAGPQPAPKVPAAKATPQRPAAKAAVRVVPAGKTAAPSELPKPAAKDRLPAKLLDSIAEEEGAPAEEAAIPEGRDFASPSVRRESTGPKPRRSSAAVSRRTTGKGKTAAAQERPNPLYLWISAGQADDLIAAVRTGLARYQERFNHVAEVVLCHSADLPTLEGAKLPVDLREGKSLAPRNFWIGSK
jgi:hypothetical protein